MPAISESLCHFANDIYSQVVKLQKDDLKNVFLSPLSIYTAMSMVLAGSSGSTREQMLKVMKLSTTMSDAELHTSIGPVIAEYFKSTTGVSVSLANRLYTEKSANIESSYKQDLKKHYNADSENVDFAEDSAGVRRLINQWVSKLTMDKIPELFPGGLPKPDTCAVIVNALYFKGQWNKMFDKASTRPADFHKLDGSAANIQLMYVKDYFQKLDLPDEEAEAIKIPFLKSKWSMLIILPYSNMGLPKTLSVLQKPGQLHRILHSEFYQENIEVRIPRFKLGKDVNVDAGHLLQEMGMSDLFSEVKADLSKICKSPKLYISDVCHKAILEVDEEGATAAAATGAIATFCCMPPQFTVTHSFFVALVYDDHTPVFVGHVTDPEST